MFKVGDVKEIALGDGSVKPLKMKTLSLKPLMFGKYIIVDVDYLMGSLQCNFEMIPSLLPLLLEFSLH